MPKKGGKRRMASDHYSLPMVAAMLLATSELWMRATSPSQAQYKNVPEPPDLTERPAEIHAELIRRLRLSDSENVLIGLADLEAAMNRVAEQTRTGIASFVTYGPMRVDRDSVQFQPYQAGHVLTVWRAINRAGEFKEERNGNENRSREGGTPRLPARAA